MRESGYSYSIFYIYELFTVLAEDDDGGHGVDWFGVERVVSAIGAFMVI